jgi:hypothetical protein
MKSNALYKNRKDAIEAAREEVINTYGKDSEQTLYLNQLQSGRPDNV